jgi:hypothetical protein
LLDVKLPGIFKGPGIEPKSTLGYLEGLNWPHLFWPRNAKFPVYPASGVKDQVSA